jgi:hypothetical protein
MYIVKFNKDTSKVWRDSHVDNYMFLLSVEKYCTHKLRCGQSLTLRDILSYLCIKEDAPHEFYIRTSADPYVDFNLTDNMNSNSPDFILSIEVNT